MNKIWKESFLAALVLSCGLKTLATDVEFDFTEGKWEKAEWKYIKVWPFKAQPAGFKLETVSFTQEKDCLSVGFPKENVGSGDDNTLMVTDCLNASGEVVLEFKADGGHGTAPGICLFPSHGDDLVMQKGIAVFVASYTMAVWQVELDDVEKITRYKLLGMTVKWFDPSKKHTLRCRFGGNSVVVSVDGSDPAHYWLQPWFPPFKDAAARPGESVKANAKVGIWGCHGKCKFYSLKVLDKPTLPLAAEKPVQN